MWNDSVAWWLRLSSSSMRARVRSSCRVRRAIVHWALDAWLAVASTAANSVPARNGTHFGSNSVQ